MTIPKQEGGRKPTTKKNFSLLDFKKKVNREDVPDKPLEWISCSSKLQEATGMPGFPKGYSSLARGFSNTGKSTSVCEAAVSAQKTEVLPIFIDTENNIGRERLKLMGFDWDNDFFLFIDNEYLLYEFGRKHKTQEQRTQASIEDMAECIHHFLDMQDNSDLPYDLLFIIDSLGTLDCIASINAHDKGSSDNNMWNANAFERSFKYLLNSRIPASKKVGKPYTNTLIAVQKIWIDNMGAGAVKHKGGEAFFHGARLIYHFGGIATHGTKKVGATSSKRIVNYGIQTKVGVVKNQVDGELGGIALEGEIISTPHGFIGVEEKDIKKYKKEHLKFFRKILEDDTITADEIGTKKEIVLNENEPPIDVFSEEMKERRNEN